MSAKISERELNEIRDDLNNSNPRLAIQAQTDTKARKELAKYVRDNYKSYIHGDHEITEYIVKELVGIGFLEDVLSTDGVTDIGWNGSFLTVETNSDKISLSKQDLGGSDVITENYIIRIVNRFLASQDKELNSTNAIVDLLMDNLRLSIVDQSLSPTGTTFSIRVTRPSLALNQNNFDIFAPRFVLDLIHTIMLTGAVCTVSGITGTGKTELQKLMISFTNPKERIIMVEDVAETHLKELFPDKDIFSYLTTVDHPITEMVRTSLRQNPNWVHIAETRGAEAFEMLQGVLTGNFMVTTLHTVDTFAVPKRFSNMITNVYANASESSIIEDVLTYFDFGFHIEKLDIYDAETGDTKKIRYLAEIREFKNNPDRGTLIFKQDFYNGQFLITTNELTEEFHARMAKKFLKFKMPVYNRELRTDIAHTKEGQLLERIRERMGVDGREVGKDEIEEVYATNTEPQTDNQHQKPHYQDLTNIQPQDIQPTANQEVQFDKLDEEEDSKYFVTPDDVPEYTNPNNLDPSQESLFSTPQGILHEKHNIRQEQVASEVQKARYKQDTNDSDVDVPEQTQDKPKKKSSFRDRIFK